MTALRASVVLASAGRPGLLAEALENVRRLDGVENIIVSVPDDRSLPDVSLLEGTVVVNAMGLPAQRNAAITSGHAAEVVFFFDDDAVIDQQYVTAGLTFFREHPDVLGLTGRVLLDGATGREIAADEALEAIRSDSAQGVRSSWKRHNELYGCNFAYRRDLLPDLQFDGRLPLYGWLEDHDFARRLLRHGVIAQVDGCVVVHRGVKSGGRMAHTRLGYAQVMNPFYLHHVRSFPAWLTAREIVFRCGKNVVLSLIGDERDWRRERVRGNAIALLDVCRRRFTPERMVEF